MNTLHVAHQNSISTLASRGWSARKIARELGVNRATVRRYIRKAAGNAGAVAPKPPAPVRNSRSSCARWRDVVTAALAKGLSAQRIYQDLVTEFQFRGSYEAVKRFVRSLGQREELPFRRMETAPGAEIQVDFGQGAWVTLPNGKKRRPHLFRAILSHSRKGYSEVVWFQNTETFLRCIENAFRHLGGVPASTVIAALGKGLSAQRFSTLRSNVALQRGDQWREYLMQNPPQFAHRWGFRCGWQMLQCPERSSRQLGQCE
ncbi:MAG: transposase [Opitutaceae bacterium]|nr:transposase [Opitutaceae bacterium]